MDRINEIASQACWFPVSIDAEKSEIGFVQTSSHNLAHRAFHDGRSPIALNGKTATIDINKALQWHGSSNAKQTPLRLIAHTSFCGSTLLARLLSLEQKTCSYREPQILAELANLKSERHSLTLSPGRWADIVAFVFHQFTLHWPDQQSAIIKPSNWANILFSELGKNSSLRIVQISSDIESYLCANLRGGKSRISYSLNLLNHLCNNQDSSQRASAEIEEMKLPGIANILHLLALCLSIQESGFEQNREHNCRVLELSKKDLLINPGKAVDQSVEVLDIARPYRTRSELNEAVRNNAKIDERTSYSPTQEDLQNAWLLREYREEMTAACLWFEERKKRASRNRDALLTLCID